MDGEIYQIIYHQMDKNSTGEGMNTLSLNPLQRAENYYTLIISSKKLDIIIKSMTENKYKEKKIHQEVER